MAFYSYSDLIQRTIVRLRQVPGAATQLYSQDEIGNLLHEIYDMVRKERWWDHMMTWAAVELDGTTGMPTVAPFDDVPERFEDIRAIYPDNSTIRLPQLSGMTNPYRVTGTTPRFIEPLPLMDDNATGPFFLFRVWPLTAVADSTKPLRVSYRKDPPNLFSDTNVIVPFDSSVLINGAAARYLAQDGTNPGAVADLNSIFASRLDQLRKAHDNSTLSLDDRINNVGLTEWVETPW